jgi:hypothetical protein
MEYYSTMKRTEDLIHTTTLMNLENIIPSKRRHHKRPYIVLFHVFE